MQAGETIFGIGWVLVIGFVVKTFLDYRIKKLLINNKMIDQNLTHLFQQPQSLDNNSSMKWGLVAVGIGIALLLKQFFPDAFSDEGAMGLIFLMGGIGFLLYNFLNKKNLNQ